MVNKRILITGGGGSIGSELVRQLAPKNKIFILDYNETASFDLTEELNLKGYKVFCRVGDVRDYKTVEDVFSDFKPEIIFHAAALKHVTPNEQYPIEAINTNILGTYNVIHCAKRYGVKKLVYVSTDKVIHANSIMGATKKVGEIMAKNSGYIAVRFGNVLGSRGSVIPIWQQQADKGEPLTITHPDMKRYFMTIPQACELVIKACEIGKPGQIMILDMGKPIKILDLAKEIIKKSGKNLKLKMIGVRPGETMDEKLMTHEEELRAKKVEQFWII